MTDPHKNSFDLLRLFAAVLVLYSHQHVLLGMVEPRLFNWTTLGGAGVAIFFFLSGFLVWSTWVRDPELKRFFVRRSLRIFPVLWFVVLLTVLVSVLFSRLVASDYFSLSETWRYLNSSLLVVRRGLPDVFVDNPNPFAVNGSLWTLPVEFLYCESVAFIGSVSLVQWNWLMAVSLGLVVLAAAFGPSITGDRFIPNLKMVAILWWGTIFRFVRGRPAAEKKMWAMGLGLAFLVFVFLESRGVERAGTLAFAVALVLIAQRVSWGSLVTDRLGDLSCGMYIFVLPVQQTVVALVSPLDWSFGAHLGVSFLATSALAYGSWYLLEKCSLRFKP